MLFRASFAFENCTGVNRVDSVVVVVNFRVRHIIYTYKLHNISNVLRKIRQKNTRFESVMHEYKYLACIFREVNIMGMVNS